RADRGGISSHSTASGARRSGQSESHDPGIIHDSGCRKVKPGANQVHDFRDAVLLRIFIGESDRFENQPLYEAIVLKAREKHLAGATVLRGPMGFGRSSRLHTAKILRLSEDLPLVIEIVDDDDKIEAFLP